MASGLVLFTYITAHFVNHALGLISLNTAEEVGYAEEVWDSLPGTVLPMVPPASILCSRCGRSTNGAPFVCRRRAPAHCDGF
jgi:hypothetical protein